MAPYLERLAARTAATGTVLCVGVDPEAGALPDGFPATLAGVERFARLIARGVAPVRSRDQAQPRVLRGVRRRRASPRSSGCGRSSRPTCRSSPTPSGATSGPPPPRQAVALFDVLGADAVTVNPYLGEEAIAPLLDRADRFAYVLCRTSNPGAAELQALEVAADDAAGWPAEPLYARVARRAASWGPAGTVGLVVGATAPAEMAAIRALAPGLAFLVPGRRRPGRRDRAGAREPAPRRRRRPAPDRAAGCSSTSRGASPGRPSAEPAAGRRPTPASVSRRPPPSGPDASLCYPDALRPAF